MSGREPDDQGDPPATAADYARLESLLADLPPVTPPPGWKAAILCRIDADDDAERAARRARPRRRWLVAAPAFAMVATVVLVYGLRQPSPPSEPGVAYAVVDGDGAVRGSGTAALHDRLQITAQFIDRGALRVYRDDRTLVAECPRDPACTRRPSGKLTTHALTLRLDAPGDYRVVLLIGAVPPATGIYDDDYAAALAAGAIIVDPHRPKFPVR